MWRQLRSFLSQAHHVYLIASVALLALCLAHVRPLSERYPHSDERFFYVLHIAQSILGHKDEIPVSFLEMRARMAQIGVRSIKENACADFSPAIRKKFCSGERFERHRGHLLAVPLQPQKTITMEPSRSATHFNVIGYMGYVIGALLALLAQAPPVVVLYASIFSNAAILTAIGFIALRNLPAMQWPLCYVLLIPSAMLMRVYVMPDALLLEVSVLTVALVLKYRANLARFHAASHAVHMLLAALLGCLKVAYAPCVGLFALVPAACFGSRARKYSWLAAYALVAAGCSFLWAKYAVQTYYPEKIHGPSANAMHREFHLLLARPIAFLELVFEQHVSFANLFTWNYCWLPARPMRSLWLLLPLVAFCWRREQAISLALPERAFLALLMAGGYVLLFITMTLHENQMVLEPAGRDLDFSTNWVQSRYLMPYLPIAALMCLTTLSLPRSTRDLTRVITCILLAVAVCYLYAGLWQQFHASNPSRC